MKTELLQIRIDSELLEKLKELAKSNSLSVSSQVRFLISKEFKNAN